MRKFNWGILGTGFAARKFLLGLRASPGAQVLAIGSRTRERAEQFGKELGVSHMYGNYEEAVQDSEVDAFYVATPPAMHRADAELCLRAGKPVLVEKPFAVTADESRALVETARSCGVFCMEGMWTRFLPAIQRAKQIVDEGALGSPCLMEGSFSSKVAFDASHHLFNMSLGGGALLDRGVYLVSLAHYFLGAPKDVSSQTHLHESGVDEQTIALLQYDQGAMANLTASFRTEAENDFVLMGTEARLKLHGPVFRPSRLSVDGVSAQTLTSASTSSQKEALLEGGVLQGLQQRLPGLRPLASRILRRSRRESVYYSGNGYHHQAEEVARCIEAGQLESKIMPLSESISILETIDQIRETWPRVDSQK
ncbi:MAG: dehydrogenase [Deltaproteobacteria bacterium]|nr:dehydrogenase [Deltaproteobacteria bacterium]